MSSYVAFYIHTQKFVFLLRTFPSDYWELLMLDSSSFSGGVLGFFLLVWQVTKAGDGSCGSHQPDIHLGVKKNLNFLGALLVSGQRRDKRADLWVSIWLWKFWEALDAEKCDCFGPPSGALHLAGICGVLVEEKLKCSDCYDWGSLMRNDMGGRNNPFPAQDLIKGGFGAKHCL